MIQINAVLLNPENKMFQFSQKYCAVFNIDNNQKWFMSSILEWLLKIM